MTGGGREVCSPKESVVTASCTLGEGIDGSANRKAPEMVSLLIVPIGDDEIGVAAENDAEIGIGVEKPFAGKNGIGNAGFAGTKARLEVLGARFEGQNLDTKRKPEESGSEASLASG